MRIGRVDLLPVHDGVARLPVSFTVSNTAGAPWSCPHQPADDLGRIRMDLGSFLVRSGDRIVLVDLGVGPRSFHEAFVSGGLLANLARADVEPEQVTDVVFSHLHVDHVGWASLEGRATFPRATYRAHADDWNFFMNGELKDPDLDPLVRTVLDPIADRFEFFDDEVELLPGLRARPAPGHTPGNTVFVVVDGNERALLLGDVAHTIAEVTEPEWESLFDIDPVAAGAVRRALADELEATGDPFTSSHFPELGFGRLVTADGLRRFLWAET